MAATPDQAAPPGSPAEIAASLNAFPMPNGNFTSDRTVSGSRINASNVAVFNPGTKKADRVGFRMLEDGRKVRFYKSNGELVSA